MAEYKAITALSKAMDATTDLLFRNFNAKFWLRLALVIFLLNLSLGGFDSIFDADDLEDFGINWTTSMILVIVVVVLFLLVLGLIFSYVGAVFQFVFLKSLADGKVEFKQWFKDNMGHGLSLFLFNIVLGIISFIIVFVSVLVAVGPGIILENTILLILGVIAIIFFIIAFIIFSAIVFSFTTDFAIPLMLGKNDGVISSWRQIIKLVKAQKAEFLVYILFKIGLGFVAVMIELVVGIAMFIAFFIIGAILAVLGIVFGFGVWELIKNSSAATPVAIVGILLALIALIVLSWITSYITIVLTLPLPVFFRYFSVYFIQLVDPTVQIVGDSVKPEVEEPVKSSPKEDLVVEKSNGGDYKAY